MAHKGYYNIALSTGTATISGTTSYGLTSIATGTSTLVVNNGNAVWGASSTSPTGDGLREYVDFALELLGIDLDYERFKDMSADDRKAMLREHRINKIID